MRCSRPRSDTLPAAMDELRVDAAQVEWRAMSDEEIVVLHVPSSTYLAVAGVGVALWPRLLDGATEEELVHAVTDRFDVDAETAQRDVGAFLAQLREQQLLTA